MNDSPILDAHGQIARRVDETVCPSCGAKCPPGDTATRQLSGGFGAVTDLCRRCGHNFGVLTIPLVGRP